ncbi:MAG: 50S ribosomal protein L24 [Candidatus Shikimatogenerans sp. JK-2022]|nr:50S ribosomal protein L24 [Candidatus Shikimatogenerans bostrichidophilus]
MFKYKNGDNIIIIAGKFKGKKGKIYKIFKKENKVNISGLLINRNIKKNKFNKGSVLNKLYKINISNISIIDPKLNIKTRIGFKIINGEKKRICKKSNIIIK